MANFITGRTSQEIQQDNLAFETAQRLAEQGELSFDFYYNRAVEAEEALGVGSEFFDARLREAMPTEADFAEAAGLSRTVSAAAGERARREREARLRGLGVDPSAGMGLAGARGSAVTQAALDVGAANQARASVKDRAMRARQALSGVAAQATSPAGQAVGSNATQGGGGLMNQANSLRGDFGADDFLAGVQGLAGVAGLAFADGGVIDGPGEVREPDTLMQEKADTVDARLSEGEYVATAPALRWHGTGLYDRLEEAARRGISGEMHFRDALPPGSAPQRIAGQPPQAPGADEFQPPPGVGLNAAQGGFTEDTSLGEWVEDDGSMGMDTVTGEDGTIYYRDAQGTWQRLGPLPVQAEDGGTVQAAHGGRQGGISRYILGDSIDPEAGPIEQVVTAAPQKVFTAGRDLLDLGLQVPMAALNVVGNVTRPLRGDFDIVEGAQGIGRSLAAPVVEGALDLASLASLRGYSGERKEGLRQGVGLGEEGRFMRPRFIDPVTGEVYSTFDAMRSHPRQAADGGTVEAYDGGFHGGRGGGRALIPLQGAGDRWWNNPWTAAGAGVGLLTAGTPGAVVGGLAAHALTGTGRGGPRSQWAQDRIAFMNGRIPRQEVPTRVAAPMPIPIPGPTPIISEYVQPRPVLGSR